MRSIFTQHGVKAVMLASTALFSASAAMAQDIPASEPTYLDEIVVVGSQIKGAKVTAALPVTVVGEELIQSTAATSGDELLRSIPQMGDVAFNSSYLPNSSNSARGDTGSVNLRNLGIGNTLVLLNGRRVVGHPTSQANEHLVPVLTYNTNAIPISGLKRMEVLRDGAAAIYGADAVAGVVNTVLRDDMNNWTVSAQYGAAEGTDMWESNFSLYGGKDIFDGRGNISMFFNYDHRAELSTLDQGYTASSNKKALFAGTGYENILSLDGRSSLSPWGSFKVLTPGVRLPNGAALTDFSIQPQGLNKNCTVNMGDDLCLRSGVGVDRELYADTAAQDLTVMPEVDRFNLFLTGRFQINDNIEAFGELGGYHAKTSARQASIGSLSSILLTVPKSNYYNPLGPITFADGTLNPNRMPGITAPADGADLQLRNYRFDDMGPIQVDVTNQQYRVLGGLRGDWNGWNWETALLYSEASAEDLSDNIETSALFRQMSLSTPDAYNPFAGSNLANPSVGGTGSNKVALDAIRTKMRRYTETSLTLWDFKVSRADLFALPAGHIGMAAGVEARHETQLDDRDSRIDGSVNFTDPVTGAVYSDLVNSSPNPDTEGKRDVYSAYLEFALPLVSPEMNIPFVHNLEAQIAGRYEHYSDFGDIAKPKVAVAWDVADGLRFRGSWAQGFRAPNLEQVNASLVTRNNSSTDWIFCEAMRLNGAIKNMNECVGASSPTLNTARIRRNVAEQRAGNPELKAEESETLSFGVVVQPDFTPANLGDFTLTIDWWSVKQEGMVGVFRGQNALTLDYLMRKQGGYNPNVVRAEASAQDKALFAAAGLDAAGEILYVMDRYDNLQPQEVQGIDLGLMWSLRGTKFGDFNANFNVSHLLKYYLDPSPQVKELMDAQGKGDIDPFISFSGSAGDLIRDGGRPEWKWSASANWRYDNVSVGAYTSYTGSVYQDTLKNNLGEAWTVDSLLTANLYGEYEFDKGLLHGTAVRIGVRNITDEKPPLASDGYLGTVHQPYGRYWYANIRKTF